MCASCDPSYISNVRAAAFPMSRIEVVPVTGGSADLSIYTRDHCPPHATCRDTTRQWTVRIAFSFLDRNVQVLSILPPRNSPGHHVVNELAQAVQRNLSECRNLWWTYQQNTLDPAGPCCLNNQVVAGGLLLEVTYDPATSSVRKRYPNGTVVEVV